MILRFILIFVFCNIFCYSVFAQQTNVLDKRALKYYSAEQIECMPVTKIKQVNYYYTKSFYIDTTNINPNCSDVKIDEIDVTQFSKNRKETTRASVGLKENCRNIILLSWKEVKEQYKKIETEQQ